MSTARIPDDGSGPALGPGTSAGPVGRATTLLILVGLVTLAAAVAIIVAEKDRVIPGLPDAGVLNEYLLRGVRAASEIAAVGTVGSVLAFAVLVPRRLLAAEEARAARLRRLAALWATAWAVAATGLLLLTSAEVVGMSVPRLLESGVLLDVVGPLPSARALMSTIAVALVVALWAGSATTSVVAWQVLALSVAGLVPPLLTSHAGHSQATTTALVSLVVHVPTAALWFGGLAALVLHLRGWSTALPAALHRFSLLAGGCFAVVAVSGALAAYSRIPDLDQLWTTYYGRLVLGKVTLLVVLGGCGAAHRRWTLSAVDAGRPRAFLRLALGELVVMASAVGLAAALATTAPPR